jgi:hypothetical protein
MAASRGRRDETTASSAMAKKPLRTIRKATTPSSRANMIKQSEVLGNPDRTDPDRFL